LPNLVVASQVGRVHCRLSKNRRKQSLLVQQAAKVSVVRPLVHQQALPLAFVDLFEFGDFGRVRLPQTL
jgi:hypothetical protein